MTTTEPIYTTQQVKIMFVGRPEGMYRGLDDERRAAEFERWLADHDRAVAEAAWDQAITDAAITAETCPTSYGLPSAMPNATASRVRIAANIRSLPSPFRSVPEENK